jgi:hypothetical protein
MATTYDSIASTTLGSAASSVTFSSIPQTYTDLVLVITGNNNQGTAYGNQLIFNNDTTGNYSYTRISGDGTSAGSGRASNETSGSGGFTNNQTDQMTLSVNQIQNYSNTTTNKTWLLRTGDTGDRVFAYVGLWRKTEAISTIKVQIGVGTYDAGSTFSLYGIKAA